MAKTAANPLYNLPNTVDLSTLSHRELHSLSLLSNPTFPSNTNTTVEKINSSFFNESASSHQQTYSTTPHHHRHHRHSTTSNVTVAISNLSENDRAESNSIVGFLKQYLGPAARIARKKTDVVEIVNKNGVVVDLAALEKVGSEDEEGGGPFAEELGRLAAGKEKEEELLEVLAGIEGRWGSQRRKRRIICASLLADALPVGWEVIIALRRKDGRFSPYCRRYISPAGEEFSSCKEVALYLKSHFGINDTELLRDNGGESQQLQIEDVNNHQCVNSNTKADYSLSDASFILNTCLPIEYYKDVFVSDIDNLPDVQVRDLYECHTCKVTFDVKNDYLKHLLSTHKSTTKTYKLGSSVGDEVSIRDANNECHTSNIKRFKTKDKYLQHQLSTPKSIIKRRRHRSSVANGVIIKDGKYGCQFCHKVFGERRSYIGHVGNHVKGSIETPKELLIQAGLPFVDRQKAKGGNLKMDALIVMAQSSIQDVLPSVLGKEPSSADDANQSSMADFNNIQNADRDSEKVSSVRVDELEAENFSVEGIALSSLLNPCDKERRKLSLGHTVPVTGEGKRRYKPLSHSPSKKVSQVSMTKEEISAPLPCPDVRNTMKISPEANILPNEMYSSERVRQILMTDEYGNTSALRHLEMEKDGRDKSSSLSLNSHTELSERVMIDRQTKVQAYSSDITDFEKNPCFDTMTIEGVDTYIHGDISTGKSTTTEDEGSADESARRYDVDFLSCNEKAFELDAAGDIVQSEYLNKHELKHGHKNDDISHAIVSGETTAIACTRQTSVNSSSLFDEIFRKAGQNICSLDPILESGSAFAYMKLDVIEPQMYKYNAMGGEDSILLPEVSMDLDKDNGFNLEFNASAKAEPELPGETNSISMTTMVCVWCGLEFSHETVEMEPQSDSVGFMCPACRAKISKQFNELESNFSVNPGYS